MTSQYEAALAYILDGETAQHLVYLNGATDISFAPELAKMWRKVYRQETGADLAYAAFRSAWVYIIVRGAVA